MFSLFDINFTKRIIMPGSISLLPKTRTRSKLLCGETNQNMMLIKRKNKTRMKPSSFPNSITAAAAVVAAATKDHDDGSIATEDLDYSNSSTATAASASASKYNIEDATTRDATRNTKKQTSAVTATKVDHDDTAKPADGSLSSSLPSSLLLTIEELPKRSVASVRFSTVEIREYGLCLGDNPSVSRGPPICLDWTYNQHNIVTYPLDKDNEDHEDAQGVQTQEEDDDDDDDGTEEGIISILPTLSSPLAPIIPHAGTFDDHHHDRSYHHGRRNRSHPRDSLLVLASKNNALQEDLKIPSLERFHLLKDTLGYSRKDIADAIHQVGRIKRKRIQTRRNYERCIAIKRIIFPFSSSSGDSKKKKKKKQTTEKEHKKKIPDRIDDGNSKTKTEEKKEDRVVQFSTVEIRLYGQCLGDNPSVSRGAPISLDWDYDTTNIVTHSIASDDSNDADPAEFHKAICPERYLSEEGKTKESTMGKNRRISSKDNIMALATRATSFASNTGDVIIKRTLSKDNLLSLIHGSSNSMQHVQYEEEEDQQGQHGQDYKLKELISSTRESSSFSSSSQPLMTSYPTSSSSVSASSCHHRTMKLSSLERYQLLKNVGGYTRHEIQDTTFQIEKIKKQRIQTRRNLERIDSMKRVLLFLFRRSSATTNGKDNFVSSAVQRNIDGNPDNYWHKYLPKTETPAPVRLLRNHRDSLA